MRTLSNTTALLATRQGRLESEAPASSAAAPSAEDRILGLLGEIYEVPLERVPGLAGLDRDDAFAAIDRLREQHKAVLIRREDGLRLRAGA